MICLDEMGPESVKSHPGTRLVRTDPSGDRRERATQVIDYGRRGKEYIFEPATGEAFTAPYAGRTTAAWVDFLDLVDGWVDPAVERVYAILDNLSTHRDLLDRFNTPATITLPELLRRLHAQGWLAEGVTKLFIVEELTNQYGVLPFRTYVLVPQPLRGCERSSRSHLMFTSHHRLK